jgi:hypothetical protein
LRDSYCQTTEFLQGEIQLVAHLFALLTIHPLEFGRISTHASVGSMGDGRDHLQITQQFLERRTRYLRLSLPLRLQKQLRLFEKALPDLGRSFSPGDIQLPGLPARELVPRKRGGHLLTVVHTATRHRYQILHRHLCRDLAHTHLLLHAVWK